MTIDALNKKDPMSASDALSMVSKGLIQVYITLRNIQVDEEQGLTQKLWQHYLDGPIAWMEMVLAMYEQINTAKVSESNSDEVLALLKTFQNNVIDWKKKAGGGEMNVVAGKGRNAGFMAETTFNNVNLMLDGLQLFIKNNVTRLKDGEYIQLSKLGPDQNETLHSLLRSIRSTFTIKEGIECFVRVFFLFLIMNTVGKSFHIPGRKNKIGSYTASERENVRAMVESKGCAYEGTEAKIPVSEAKVLQRCEARGQGRVTGSYTGMVKGVNTDRGALKKFEGNPENVKVVAAGTKKKGKGVSHFDICQNPATIAGNVEMRTQIVSIKTKTLTLNNSSVVRVQVGSSNSTQTKPEIYKRIVADDQEKTTPFELILKISAHKEPTCKSGTTSFDIDIKTSEKKFRDIAPQSVIWEYISCEI